MDEKINLPKTDEEMASFIAHVKSLPLGEQLQTLVEVTTHMRELAEKLFPLPPGTRELDISAMTREEKIQLGAENCRQLRLIATNLPTMRKLEQLDRDSVYDEASADATLDVLTRVSKGLDR